MPNLRGTTRAERRRAYPRTNPYLRGSANRSQFSNSAVPYNTTLAVAKPQIRVHNNPSADTPSSPSDLQIGTLEEFQIGSLIQRGDGEANRFGSKVYVSKINVTAYFRNSTTLQKGWLRMMVLQNLRPADTHNQIGLFEGIADWYQPVDYEISNGTDKGSVNQIFKKINQMGYRVLHDKRHRLLEDQPDTDGKNVVTLDFDVPVNRVFTWRAGTTTIEDSLLPNIKVCFFVERDSPTATTFATPIQYHYEIREFFLAMV